MVDVKKSYAENLSRIFFKFVDITEAKGIVTDFGANIFTDKIIYARIIQRVTSEKISIIYLTLVSRSINGIIECRSTPVLLKSMQ